MHKQPVCLQKPSNVIPKITGTASVVTTWALQKKCTFHIILIHLFIFLMSCRFFGNRSYCYYCLEQYPQALADAERSIQLAPDWPKGYFRKGSALMGMKVGTSL